MGYQSKRVFSENSFLGMIDHDSREALSAIWRTDRVSAGAMIIAADDPATSVVLLLSGGARASTFTADGKQITFVEIGKGECFGEFAMIDGGVRSASVIATRDSDIARISNEHFRVLILKRPELAFSLMRLLVCKLRDMSQRLEEYSVLRIDQRVRLELVRVAKKYRISPDAAEILSPPTQAEIAAKVLANREGVAKEMGKLRTAGLIRRRGRALIIPSISRLEASVVFLAA